MSDVGGAPRFTVVVPAFNAGVTIRETLDSIAGQEFDAWECIVVNDGSADDTAAIARGFCERDGRFALLEQENQGAASAHNAGVRAAAGEFIVLCAADDLLMPAHMRVMDDLIARNRECRIFSCNGYHLDHLSGERTVRYPDPEWQHERSLTFAELVAECFFSVGAAYARELWTLVGGFRPGAYVDDYDFWLRAMAAGVRHRYTPELLAVHRISGFQQSADLIRVWESDIGAYEFLIDNGLLAAERRPFVDAAIELRRGFIRETLAQRNLESQTSRIEAAVHRVLGERAARPVLALARGVSKILWPLRVWLARRRAG